MEFFIIFFYKTYKIQTKAGERCALQGGDVPECGPGGGVQKGGDSGGGQVPLGVGLGLTCPQPAHRGGAGGCQQGTSGQAGGQVMAGGEGGSFEAVPLVYRSRLQILKSAFFCQISLEF